VLRSHYFGLRKIFDGWQLPRDPQTGAFAGDLKAADEHYKWLSQKFGYAIATPENVINQLGYQFLFAGKSEEAIATFKANVERYADSANVYDSLAEAYEKTGRIDLAAPLYEKAQNIGQRTNDPNYAIYKTNFQRATDKLKQAEAAKKDQK
ncbi:MAG TPA: tetratricopeptide repeat protein, partial [Pyrinomonadaceae bacterium]